jgi:aminoglycoside phosphotransferase (APT) family kinase protein
VAIERPLIVDDPLTVDYLLTVDCRLSTSPVRGDTRPVRPTEQLNWDALASYLRLQLPDHAITGLDLSREMEVTQFPGGHSNLTYLIRFGGAELVIRRPPLGPVAPTAHDMAREYRWLAAMHPVFPLAPRPYLLCDDPNVIGSVFYVMERRRGIVVRHDEPLGLANRPEERRKVSEALIDTMADLHAIDVTGEPLANLGKPAGFVARQIRGWTERWQRSKTSELAEMDALAAWLAERIPPDPAEPAVVHGDFKLDNILLDPLEMGHVVAVFDWEMSALGDPLVDLGILLAYWSPTAPPEQRDALTIVTDRPGYLTRAELIDRYAARSGRDVSAIRFYETFALFKIAVVIQQIFYRYKQGQTDDARFANFGDRVTYLARAAAALVR